MYLGDLGVTWSEMMRRSRAVQATLPPIPSGGINPATLPQAQPFKDPIKGQKVIGYSFLDNNGNKRWVIFWQGALTTNAQGDLVYARPNVPSIGGMVVSVPTGLVGNSALLYDQEPFTSGYYEVTRSKNAGVKEMWIAFGALVAAPFAAAAISAAVASGAAGAGATAGTAASAGTTGAAATATGAAATGAAATGAAATGAAATGAAATGAAGATGAGALLTSGVAAAKAALPLLKSGMSAYQAFDAAQQALKKAKSADEQSAIMAQYGRDSEAAMQAALAEQYRAEAAQYSAAAGVIPGISNETLLIGGAALLVVILLSQRRR